MEYDKGYEKEHEKPMNKTTAPAQFVASSWTCYTKININVNINFTKLMYG